jgi:putative SOS response-associated peptidase YedK
VCGRYALYNDPSAVVRRLRARAPTQPAFAARYNIAPTTPVLAIDNASERSLREMRWGLLPRFAERKPARRSTFNARIETLATSPLYGPLLPVRRCIVLADGYYEWPVRPDRRPTPFWIFHADGSPILFAGLWDGDAVTIVTQPPNEALARVHDRMPASLDEARADAWLTNEALSPEAALALLEPSGPEIWAYHRVARTVGNVRADGPELLEAVPDEPPGTDQLSLFPSEAPP